MNTLITFLGNSRRKGSDTPFNYQNTSYSFNQDDNNDCFETPFIFESIIQHHLYKSEPLDAIFIVGTVHSCWQDLFGYYISKNESTSGQTIPLEDLQYWEDIQKKAEVLNYHSTRHDIEQFQTFLGRLERLIEESLSATTPVKVSILLIQYGLTESESFYNYNKLCSIENFFDEKKHYKLWLDITHCFRHMPMYEFLVMNYFVRISELKIDISGIYYGMFELLHDAGLSRTPVINMKYLLDTMNWINGTNELISYGSVYGINNCISNSHTTVADWLHIFEWSTNTNNYNLLTESIAAISRIDFTSSSYSSLEKDALKKISSSLKKQFGKYRENQLASIQLALSEWFFQQRRYGLAIIMIQECLKSYVAYLCYTNNPKNINNLSEDDITKKISDEGFRSQSLDVFSKIAHQNKKVSELHNLYRSCKNMRNTTAHALQSTETHNKTSSELLDNVTAETALLGRYIKTVKSCMQNNDFENAWKSFFHTPCITYISSYWQHSF